MFFSRRKPEPPKPDRLAAFQVIVHEAIGNATTERNNDWQLKVRIAEALENFASAVRTEIAMRRPIC